MSHYYLLAALVIGLSTVTAWASLNAAAGLEFDEELLVGKSIPTGGLARFAQGQAIQPGKYLVDVFFNHAFLSREQVDFVVADNGEAQACVNPALLEAATALPELSFPNIDNDHCTPLDALLPGSSAAFDFTRLRLDLLVPQALLKHSLPGAVPLAALDSGVTMAFANYDSNYYRTTQSGLAAGSLYLGLSYGLNLGLWQWRQQASFTRSSGASAGTPHWQTLRTYVQRALPQWQSELTLGDAYTAGGMFSSVGFRGVQISTDERMRPDSVRGYAPTLRGTAATTAKVTVLQAGVQIYQTTVAPGPFVIDDLYPTSSQGDLDVEVTEADGRISSFRVPFNALPQSMRPGQYRAAFSAGQVLGSASARAAFAEATLQVGVNNALTANGGLRLAPGYQAVLLGSVSSTRVGAFGLDMVFSDARVEHGETRQGWQFSGSWSQTFLRSGTTVSLAGYRYSTGGYRELQDVLGQRATVPGQTLWASDSYEQRSQVTASISQAIGRFGQLDFSGATTDYRNGRARDTQYQLTHSTHFGRFSLNLAVSRQHSGASVYGVQTTATQAARSQNSVMLSLSVPLGARAIVAGGFTHQSGDTPGNNWQTNLSGTAGEMDDTNYSITVAQDRQPQGRSNSASVNVQQALAYTALGTSLSAGAGYRQLGLSARGAVVAHSGGLTTGPYLTDTFGLVEAKGATGASVRNANGARVNAAGYALVPSLQPYRYNDVALDAPQSGTAAELINGQQRVAPYAGAAVLLQYATRAGYALLIHALRPDGAALPLGAEVRDGHDQVVGLVGQGSQIYARAEGEQGALSVQWGDAADAQCKVRYQLSAIQQSQPLIRLDMPCLPTVLADAGAA